MDRSVKPGDDFYRYANGGWLKVTAIPAGQPSYGTRAMLIEKTSRACTRSHSGSGHVGAAKGTIAQKVGDYYAAFMDEEAIEARGLETAGRRNGHDLSDHQQDVAVSLSRHHLEHRG